MAPIRNAAQVLKHLDLQDPRLCQVQEVIQRQVTHLNRLIDDLLDVSRITHGRITLHQELLELTAIIEQALEVSRPLIEARCQSLVVHLPPCSVWLNGDSIRLTQVLSNLLNNAATYTGEGGRIALVVTVQAGEVLISVKDTGCGITSELLPHVFELFTQGKRPLDRGQGGLGIGLTLVKNLVELHGGRVEARSPGPEGGTEFLVRLPCLAEPNLPLPPVEPMDAAGPGGGRKVLVVDDNADAVESLALWLALEGYEVKTAGDGLAALALVPAFDPEIVILDIGLPGMDGYEVARRLRAQDPTAHRLLIALTGYGQEADRQCSQAAGFDHHLVKPADPEQLQALMAPYRRACVSHGY